MAGTSWQGQVARSAQILALFANELDVECEREKGVRDDTGFVPAESVEEGRGPSTKTGKLCVE